MLDGFELRLADLIADELAGLAPLQLVTRPRSDLAAAIPDDDRAAIVIHTLNASSEPEMGNDARERRGAKGEFRLRTTLRLKGQVAADVAIRLAEGDNLPARRGRLIQVMDVLLAAMQRDRIRNGRAFLTGEDLGFELDGFRLVGFRELDTATSAFDLPAEFAVMRVIFEFSGKFWPVEPLVEGAVIAGLPTRIAVMPPLIPAGLTASAGGPDLRVPIGLDLRAVNGAGARVIARLKGASPPGSLVGDIADVPTGWTAFTPATDGTVAVLYRPPAALGSAARVNVSLALHEASRPSVSLGDFSIEVAPA